MSVLDHIKNLTDIPFFVFDIISSVPADDFSFTCSEDIKITGFYLLNESANISNITLESETDDAALDQIWDSIPMDFSKGTVLTPLISVYEKALEGNATYFTIIYVVMEYEINGQKFEAYYHSMFRTRPNAYEVYASEVDEVDVLSYYLNFYDKIRIP